MKISQKIQQSAKEDKVWWSFEYFPPRTAQVLTSILEVFSISRFPSVGLAKLARSYRAYASAGPRVH